MDGASVAELRREGAAQLAAVGIEPAQHEATVLLAHVLDWSMTRPMLQSQHRPDPAQTRVYWHLIALRASRMPLQYVTHDCFFGGLRLRCDPRALIPRPETELLAELAADRLRDVCAGRQDAVVDVGCGTGAIALYLAAQLPCQIIATDLSAEALALTRGNVALHGFDKHVVTMEGSFLEPVLTDPWREQVVGVVSNPPYVRPDDMAALAPELAWEPRAALQAPTADGLGAYREILRQARQLPRLRLIALEVGYDQACDVAVIASELGEVEVLRDYAGIERFVMTHVSA